MRKFVLPILLIVFIVLIGYYNINKNKPDINMSQSNSAQNKVILPKLSDDRIGTDAPIFTLYDTESKKVTLSDFKGKKVLLNFWASWCGPCREEMPLLNTLNQNDKDKYVIIAVNLEEDKKTLSKFLRENGYTFRVLLDEQGEVADIYRISKIPTSFFIDENGIIKYIKTGILNESEIKDFYDQK